MPPRLHGGGLIGVIPLAHVEVSSKEKRYLEFLVTAHLVPKSRLAPAFMRVR